MDDPKVYVQSLSERDAPITAHFSLPEIQYIGSTSQCGCDFPNVNLFSGDWEIGLDEDSDDADWKATVKLNCGELAVLLQESGEKIIELYGIWLSGDQDFAGLPKKREEIQISDITNPRFRFRERCFYRVNISD